VRFRLIPRERSFYPLFRRAADNLADAAQKLKDEIENFVDVEVKHKEIVACELMGDELTREILRKLNSTYVTPFDREDIYALTERIDDVVDSIRGVSDLLILHQIEEPLPENQLQAQLLAQAADAVAALVAKLEVMRGIETETELIDSLESSADKVYRRTVARLFSGDYEPRELLRWKDIVEGIEDAMNGIEDVANVVETIVLKHA
jgi:predicted phosphate transport protein (TIGR00153 family)